MEVPVLIVGGGPAGLSMSVLLSRLGVSSLLVERNPGTSVHPKARNLNLRTAEILRPWGIDADLRKGSLPEEWGEQFVYTRTLAGEEVGRMPTAGFCTPPHLSPARALLSSQDLIEPAIRRYAESFACAEVRFAYELSDFWISDDGVDVTLHDKTADVRREVRTRYLIAADGATSSVRERLEIPLEGARGLGSFMNVYFRSDLGRWTEGRPAVLYWTSEPGAEGVFQPLDGVDRWLCQIPYDAKAESEDDWPPDRCADWIRRAIGSDDVALEILSVRSWTMSATVARSLRSGPVFLVGDAAHQLPPTGGFGMNTGVQDAHNLAWKLAGVIDGWADPRILDTYERERRPVGAYNARHSLENARMVGRVNASVRSGGNASAAVEASRRYGNFLGMDIGFAYAEGALLPDGTDPPEVEDEVADYVPTARPGHRAPHVALRRGAVALSTLDLFDERFALLAGPEGAAWSAAAAQVRGGVPLVAYVVGADGNLSDPGGRWLETYGLERDGAVLVRPDGHVAWRCPRGAPDPSAVLEEVLRAVLGSDRAAGACA
jgi:2-polyprenyl-6-methoxyphenol hydroxylase-like FAD-dependent oxidoreductase